MVEYDSCTATWESPSRRDTKFKNHCWEVSFTTEPIVTTHGKPSRLVDAIGRPRHRPDCVLGDRGYDAESIRQGLRDRRIIPFLAKRNTEHGSGLGRWRWVVERTFARLNQFRRLRGTLRKAGGHSRGILVLGVCSDLLALPASQLSGELKVEVF